MKKVSKYIVLVLIFIVIGTSMKVFATEDEFEYREEEGLQRVILIDPGHGGSDGGATSKNGILEKDLNLKIALKLKEELKCKGYEVFLTREKDEELSKKKRDDLYLRCKMKKEVKSAVFISIHQNKFGKTNCKGAQLWHASNKKSKELANYVQESIKVNLQKDNERIPKDAKQSFFILKDGNKEANVILECGFISNEEDEKSLSDEVYQNKLTNSIAKGIDNYYKNKIKK
ncbi:N-acetylmuramoyl-L-alanine amidase [uncultured Clostridium sp.]|uniref:N-acetylmuramoyl-L-alanine amidase n=1 Tax=uncultured Clostridium sp. TaxID=59620 RepID=UPI0026297010|nr:N-acetylmuramoyl-L-alanine amidase [uncultured Clostridium sp.]